VLSKFEEVENLRKAAQVLAGPEGDDALQGRSRAVAEILRHAASRLEHELPRWRESAEKGRLKGSVERVRNSHYGPQIKFAQEITAERSPSEHENPHGALREKKEELAEARRFLANILADLMEGRETEQTIDAISDYLAEGRVLERQELRRLQQGRDCPTGLQPFLRRAEARAFAATLPESEGVYFCTDCWCFHAATGEILSKPTPPVRPTP
jgi:hypothetical protein